MSKILEAGLYYAGHGLGVIPLKPGLKCPATKNGLLDGTTDPDQIKRWFEKDGQNKNIGIVTGSGFAAVDIDVKGGFDGYAELEELEKQYGELPVTTGQKNG